MRDFKIRTPGVSTGLKNVMGDEADAIRCILGGLVTKARVFVRRRSRRASWSRIAAAGFCGLGLAAGRSVLAEPAAPPRIEGPLVQITCIPEMRFLSVLTKVEPDGAVVGRAATGEPKALRDAHGIWRVSDLKAHPLVCRFAGAVPVVVSVADYDGGGGEHQCEAGVHYKLVIALDDRRRYQITPAGYCTQSDHLIAYDGARLTDCLLSADGVAPSAAPAKPGCAAVQVSRMPMGVSTGPPAP